MTLHRELPLAIVAADHSSAKGLVLDATGLAWNATLLLLMAAWFQGWLPLWALLFLGVCAFVRNFNAAHLGFHAEHRGNWLRPARHLALLPLSPFSLGYDALWTNHKQHHANPGSEKDPDHFLIRGGIAHGTLAALLQPEWAAARWLSRHGASRSFYRTQAWNLLFLAGLFALGGWKLMGAWVLLTRIGNTASWVIFDWMLHHPVAWGSNSRLPIPRVLRPLWILLFSKSNLLSVEHHSVHHKYAFVPAEALPALAKRLDGQDRN
jgi:fatty acid desaturase